MGASNFAMSWRARGWDGIRMPIIPVPPVRIAGTQVREGRTTVTGPGRNVSKKPCIHGSVRATARSMSKSETAIEIGMASGRFFVS